VTIMWAYKITDAGKNSIARYLISESTTGHYCYVYLLLN